MNRIVYFSSIIFFLIFIQCTEHVKNDKNLFNDAIKLLVEEKNSPLKNGFLVNPYLNHFEFNTYFKKDGDSPNYNLKLQNEILKKIDINFQSFKKIQTENDSLFLDKYNSHLLALSAVENSRLVVTFSSLNNKIFFIEMINYCDYVSKGDLIERKLENDENLQDVYALAAIIENNKIVELIHTGSGHTERCVEAE